MSDPVIYTIGWICAIGTELVAATSFLDEEHGDLEHAPVHDNNSYILGRIGRHNVVIAAPGGQHGLVPAAHIGRDMLRTFPNIRTRLMVGIGGGAPSPKHDIRLGDVVVSTPGDGSGGVHQYDYGRAVQDSMFAATGHQNQPPQFMSTVVNLLKARYEQRGHEIEKAIENVLASNTRLRNFQRPDLSRDRLYNSAYTHAGTKDQDCTVLCDASQLTRSLDPFEERDNPTIHYGIIASANQLMRDANLRDRISRENDVLCFEMEAAGLMNDFPCLVIRGICDYSDTHKNKIWQGYAAMAAAAYAKDLLLRLTPNQVEAGTSDPSLARVKGKYLPLLRFSSMTERQLELEQELKQNSVPGTYQWLFETKEHRNWISRDLSLPVECQPLLLEGKPGSGKSILMSAAFERSKNLDRSRESIHVAFFFDGRSKIPLNYSSQGLYRSLLSQLLDQMRGFPAMSEMTKSWPTNDDQEWGVYILKDSITRIVRGLHDRDLHIYVDALDECDDNEKGNALSASSVIDFLIGLQKEHARTWLCLASRDRNRFGARLNMARVIQVDRENQDGIKLYIDTKMPQTFSEAARTRLTNIISDRSSNMFLWAKYVVLGLIDDSSLGYSEKEMEEHIKGVKTELKDFYRLIFQKLDVREPHETRTLIELMHVAMRDLTLEEAISALDHAQGDKKLSGLSAHDAAKRVRALCRGLVEVRERPSVVSKRSHITTNNFQGGSGTFGSPDITSTGTIIPIRDQAAVNSTTLPTQPRELKPTTSAHKQHTETQLVVQFTHHTVKEFLDDVGPDSTDSNWLKSSLAQRHLEAAQICMRTLEDIKSQTAFRPYATQFWTTHARKGDSAIDNDFKAPDFVYKCKPQTSERIKHFGSAVMALGADDHLHKDDRPNARFLKGENSLLALLAFEGCTQLFVRHTQLCRDKKCCFKNSKSTDIFEAALFLAASRGWSDTVRSILEIAEQQSLKVDVNKLHWSHMTPLYATCFRGKTETADLLIKSQADIFGEAGKRMQVNLPFHFAAAQGYRDIVELFLEAAENADDDGATIKKLLFSTDRQGCTVFHQTAKRGSSAVLDILTDYISDLEHVVHTKNTEGHTAREVAIHARERTRTAPGTELWIQQYDEVIDVLDSIMLEAEQQTP